MLSREYRLTKKNDFDNVFRNGSFYKNSFFYLVKSTNNLKNNRFGFIVSSKNTPLAVDRNKLKRRIRAVIEKKVFFMEVGFDVVIGAYKNSSSSNFTETKDKILELLIVSKIIKSC